MFARDYDTDREVEYLDIFSKDQRSTTFFQFKGTLKEGEWKKEYVCKVDGVFPEYGSLLID